MTQTVAEVKGDILEEELEMLGDFDLEQYELRRSKSHPSCHPEWKPMNSSNPMPKKIKPENSTAAYFQGELTPKEGKIIFF